MNREELVAYVQRISESGGFKLKVLLEKEKELIEKGNKYGEKFTKRQFDLAVDPIIKAEYSRSQILELTRKESMSISEIAKALKLSPKDILQHISILRRRSLLVIESIEGRIPKYRGLFEEAMKSANEHSKDEK